MQQQNQAPDPALGMASASAVALGRALAVVVLDRASAVVVLDRASAVVVLDRALAVAVEDFVTDRLFALCLVGQPDREWVLDN